MFANIVTNTSQTLGMLEEARHGRGQGLEPRTLMIGGVSVTAVAPAT